MNVLKSILLQVPALKGLFRVLLSCLFIFCLIPHAYAAKSGDESEAAKPNNTAKHLINFQISAPHRSKTYSCNLIAYSHQCREYEILASAQDTIAELTEGCESMGGKFTQTECPEERFMASCVDIVRNYHRPDVIYNNLYYGGEHSHWQMKDIERVCADLGGELEE